MNDLELWKKVVKDAKIGSPCCSNIFDEMLAELNKGDAELVLTPSYISILKFGRNIFKPVKEYRKYYDLLELTE
jgi:hypothetical protein